MPTFFAKPPSDSLYTTSQEDAVRKTVAVSVALSLALIVAMIAWTARADAQGQAFPGPDVQILEGVGSSIGVSVRDATREELEKAKLTSAGGALVTSVREGGPAAKAGFRTGDLITEFDGERVRSARHLTRLVRETPSGRSVKSSIVRDGSRQAIDITPEAREGLARFPLIGPDFERGLRDFQRNLPRDFSLDIDPDFLSRPFSRESRRLGASLLPLEDQLASYFGVKQGALVASVTPESSAARAGLKAGDVITAIGGRSVDGAADVRDRLRDAAPGSTLELTIVRDKKEMTLKAAVPETARRRLPETRRYREI